jgi:signal transduction histidine kinase
VKNRDTAPASGEARRASLQALFRFRVRKRNFLRIGFGLVTALLAFSLFQAYKIQASLSEETLQIYHRHVTQEDLLSRLRRISWLGANLSRDYLVYPEGASGPKFFVELASLKVDSQQLVDALDKLPGIPVEPEQKLKRTLDEFWGFLMAMPSSTRNLDAAGRYDFIQREIAPRRNAIGDLVREFAQLGQDALKQSETEFARTRREFARRLLVILGISFIVGLAVAVFSLLHSDSLERQSLAHYEAVEHAKTELQQLSARLMDVQEQERVRLSRELHDEIGQMVATLRLEITRAASLPPHRLAEMRERLVRARDLAGRTVQGVRDICALLRPTMLDDLGLLPALQWQVEDFTRRTGIVCDLQEKNLDESLPDPIKTCAYRVLQESLHNCEKHAAATRVRVSIERLGNTLHMEIEDNGRGFESSPHTRAGSARFGILGMRERATAADGDFEVQSAPGCGTRLRLRLPLPDPVVAEPKAQEVHA